jgi:hypothetical protein
MSNDTLGAPTYTKETAPYEQLDPVLTPNSTLEMDSASSSFLQNFSWSYEGTTTVNGKTVGKYVASSKQEGTKLPGSFSTAPANISDVSGEVYVDEQGFPVQTKITYTMPGQDGPVTVTVDYSLTKIDQTSVSEPSWLSEAKSQTE